MDKGIFQPKGVALQRLLPGHHMKQHHSQTHVEEWIEICKG